MKSAPLGAGTDERLYIHKIILNTHNLVDWPQSFLSLCYIYLAFFFICLFNPSLCLWLNKPFFSDKGVK